MMIEDLKVAIKNHILKSINQSELYSLCNFFNIPTTGFRELIRKRLIDSILVTNDVDILHRVLIIINKNGDVIGQGNKPPISQPAFPLNRNMPINEIPRINSVISLNDLHKKLYCINNYNLSMCPINIRHEIPNEIDPNGLFIPNFTKFPSGCFQVPIMSPTLTNGRLNAPTVQVPYSVRDLIIKNSQFYCCQVILHPLSLLIPRPSPNINQTTRMMSKLQLYFTLSNDTKRLLEMHCSQNKNRKTYKWQVLIRFGMYDPTKPFPIAKNSDDIVPDLPECIPPYLTINVNGSSVPLWDILPSNTTAKEGKRHPRPVNITDYLKFFSPNTVENNTSGIGHKQSILVNWWQTPGVYQYYYVGVFLERKVAVNELIDRFVNRTHSLQKPISYTFDFIRVKFSLNQSSRGNFGDDDLVISSVLPISLLCPVGRSRITCPIRSIRCLHLQCFDAHLYLLMNERRSVWKCPVCDAQATLEDLFVDEFFLKILQQFADNEKVTEVNVNPDCSYTAVAVKESRDRKQKAGNIISNIDRNPLNTIKVSTETRPPANGSIAIGNQNNPPIILLESDDEDFGKSAKKMPAQSTNSETVFYSAVISNQNDKKLSENSSQMVTALTVDLTSDSDNEKEINKIPNIINSKNMQINCGTPNNFESVMLSNLSKMPTQPIEFGRVDNRVALNFMELTKSCNDSLQLNNFYQPTVNKTNWRMEYPLMKNQPVESVLENTTAPQNFSEPKSDISNCSIPQLQSSDTSHVPQCASSHPKLPSQSIPNSECRNSSVSTTGSDNATLNLENQSQPVSRDKVRVNDKKKRNKQPSVLKIVDNQSQKPNETRASRRSSRISNLSRKSYFETHTSDDDHLNSRQAHHCDNTNQLVGDLKMVIRLKRPSPLDDSVSSTSSQNKPIKRRLLSDSSEDEKCNVSGQSSLVADWSLGAAINDLKCPVVILNKLDPVVLKGYLFQETDVILDQDFSNAKEQNQCVLESRFDSTEIFNGIKNQF